MPAGGSDSYPLDVRMPGFAGTRNMERLTLGGRGTVTGCAGGRDDRTHSLARCKDRVARGASPTRLTLNHQVANPPPARRARRGWGTYNSGVSRTHGAAAPPQPRALARPARSFKRLEGSAAAADVLARQREQPTGGYGTPKGAAGLARHVPTRAKNEPGRADDVTGQTSDCR